MAYSNAGNFSNSISYSFSTAGPFTDLGASVLNFIVYSVGAAAQTRYISGSTNRLLLTPASGNTTINSIDASGVSDGFTMLLVNNSSTANLVFNHLGSTTTNGAFSNVNGGQVALLPLGAARCTYVASAWQFA